MLYREKSRCRYFLHCPLSDSPLRSQANSMYNSRQYVPATSKSSRSSTFHSVPPIPGGFGIFQATRLFKQAVVYSENSALLLKLKRGLLRSLSLCQAALMNWTFHSPAEVCLALAAPRCLPTDQFRSQFRKGQLILSHYGLILKPHH